MKIALVLCMFLSGAAFAFSEESEVKRVDDFPTFWTTFKSAVISVDKRTVSSLSRFPIGMSYGIRSIKNSADLNRRFREVFNNQTDAAKCFSSKEPAADSDNAKRFSIGCPDSAGNEVVIYEFERTKSGWKFVQLDNINE